MQKTFSEIFRAAVDREQVTLAHLARECTAAGAKVSAATLSYWINGGAQPRRRSSLEVLSTLERLLNLNPGHLANHVVAGDESWRYHRADLRQLTPHHAELQRCRTDWGLPLDEGLHREHVIGRRTVTDDGYRDQFSTTLRSQRDGLDRFLSVLRFDGGWPRRLPESVTGCTRGREAHLGDEGMVFEIILPRPLQEGELTTLSFTYPEVTGEGPVTSFDLLSLCPTSLLTAQVRFTAERPVSVVRSQTLFDRRGSRTDQRTPPMRVVGGVVQHTIGSVSMGGVGLEFVWG